ncbi:9079_t:CDS:1, partial [Ambispora leptoticha]
INLAECTLYKIHTSLDSRYDSISRLPPMHTHADLKVFTIS